jgi:hypothetical protein
MLIPKRFYTYAAVSDLYREQCGDVGVLEFFRSSFAQSVIANGGYSPVLEDFQPLSVKESRALGLTQHKKATWYRLDGTGIQGSLVGSTGGDRFA